MLSNPGREENGCFPLPLENVLRFLAGRKNFAFFETRRFDGENRYSLLFTSPVARLETNEPGRVRAFFSRALGYLEQGYYLAGFFSYEAAAALDDSFARLALPRDDSSPLLSFQVFPPPLVFDHRRGTFNRPLPPARGRLSPGPAATAGPALNVSRSEYLAAIARVKELIAAGDTYQVNYTVKQKFRLRGDIFNFYRDLAARQSVSYTAFIRSPGIDILSFSPELFFRYDADSGRIVTRPMKGTIRRGRDGPEDRILAEKLRHSPKDRSENLMIVDLLRNDLGRLALPGTVRVEKLFEIESYETLFQMTSTISARVRPGLPPGEIFRALFPCGSVTGAPKLRTMEIIREIEKEPRGIYTGAVGYFAPGGSAVFNVAIRTVFLRGREGEMGIGGGIVWDSDPGEEYRECLLKSRFLDRPPPSFRLLETIAWASPDGYAFLEEHLERLSASAAWFGFACPRDRILRRLSGLAAGLDPEYSWIIRLLLRRDGRFELESRAFDPPRPGDCPRAALADRPVSSRDTFLYHKTTRRPLYDRYRLLARENGFFDFIFRNERGELTEGAISNLFLRRGETLYTPPVSCGLLPGILRAHLLETGRAKEKILRVADLAGADAVYLGNSVRGLVEVGLDMVKY